MKLDYEDIIPECKESNQAWDEILSAAQTKPVLDADLKAAVQNGMYKWKMNKLFSH